MFLEKSKKKENQRKALAWVEKIQKEYPAEIHRLVENTVLFPEQKEYDIPEKRFSGTEILVVKCSTVDAAIKEGKKGETPCALNFASYRHPGGGFLGGSMAQEESLCHASTLYPVLAYPKIRHVFYDKHEGNLNRALYHSDLLYTPRVSFLQGNTLVGAAVITCAAPNKRAAQERYCVTDKECSEAMKHRIDAVLSAAAAEREEVLILGAFGCGAFGNNVEEVAEIFREFLDGKYSGAFRKVVFAVLDKPTYEKMRNVLVQK